MNEYDPEAAESEALSPEPSFMYLGREKCWVCEAWGPGTPRLITCDPSGTDSGVVFDIAMGSDRIGSLSNTCVQEVSDK